MNEDLERKILHDRPKPDSPRPLPESNRMTPTNSHGLIDTAKTDKEWGNELSPKRFLDKWQKYVDQGKEAGCKEIEISNEAMDRLISMARQGINYQTIEIVDGWTIEDLVDKVRLYENVLREIANQVGKRASDLARVATEALGENKNE